jgi:molybdate transport system substrate-binding protein
MRLLRGLWLCLLAFAGPIGFPEALHAQAPPRVAAASDLQFALDAIAKAFTAETGERVSLVFGSSGNLARQIMSGAPFEMFLSADEAFVDALADAGYARDRGMLYAIGRIVLFAPPGSPLVVDEQMTGLRALLAKDSRVRFAIANPEHAPYGRAAEAALRARGLWDVVQPSLVLGENISQTAQFATAGGAAGGIIAYSLVLAPALKDRGAYTLIPESLHPPLRQRMVLLKRASPAAQRFYEYLQRPAARALLAQYGFALPN